MMRSDYSRLRKDSYLELQVQSDPIQVRSHQEANKRLLPSEAEIWADHKVVDEADLDMDIDAPDIDEQPGANKWAGVPGAVFNLATSIVGAGIMALPATMKVLGLLLGLLLILLIGVISEVSVELLVRFTILCKAKSYGEVVQCAMGRTAKLLAEICIIINNGGVMVVYLIIIGDVLSGSARHIGVFDQWLGNGMWDHRKLLILFVLIVFLAPLCTLDRIDSLSMTSAASVVLAIVFVMVCVTVAGIKLAEGSVESPRMLPDFGSRHAILDLLVVIPIMTNAYVCHFNLQPIYNELEGRSAGKMNHVGRISTVLCVMIYAATAVSGYLLFGNGTEADVLTNFDKNLGIHYSGALNYIVRVGYILHLILVFPVMNFSLRQTVNDLLFEKSPPLVESRKRSLILTATLLVLIYIGSTCIPNIWTAFKFTGATTAVSLGFTFPALVALKLGRKEESLTPRERIISWSMLIMAVVVSVVGVAGNLLAIRDDQA